MKENVGVVIVCKDDPSGLENTLGSLLSEEVSRQLSVVVQDGSSIEILPPNLRSECERTFFEFTYVNEPDEGIYDAMNKACSSLKTKYVWFLNSGDVALNLSMLFSSLKKNDSVIHTYEWLLDGKKKNFDFDFGVIRKRIRSTWCFRHQSIVYDTEFIQQIGLYNPFYKVCGDRDLMVRIIKEIRAENYSFWDFPISDNAKSGLSKSRVFERELENIMISVRHSDFCEVPRTLWNSVARIVYHFFLKQSQSW